MGRGGKRGTTSGRGQKGQKARAGHSLKPAERDLIQRIPKLRGSNNKRKSEPAIVISVGRAEHLAEKGVLTPAILVAKGIIKRAADRVKILDGGACTQAISIVGIPASKTAKEKIEKAGGKVN